MDPRFARPGGESAQTLRFSHHGEAEQVGHDRRRLVGLTRIESDARETEDGVLGRYRAVVPRIRVVRSGLSYQCIHQTVGIVKDDLLFVKDGSGRLHLNAVLLQPVAPEIERTLRHGKGCHANLSSADAAGSRSRPGERGQDGARCPSMIAEVEVIGLGHVEVDGHLERPQSKHSGVEIEISLRVADDRRDVMDTGHFEVHDVAPFPLKIDR